MNSAKKMVLGGWVMSALAIVPFVPSTIMKLTMNPQVIEGMSKFGFVQGAIMTLAIIELVCVILYLIPKTAFLGAILITGYLGGAICTHFRVGENVVVQIVLGVLIWGGLYLRDSRLRSLIPFVRSF